MDGHGIRVRRHHNEARISRTDDGLGFVLGYAVVGLVRHNGCSAIRRTDGCACTDFDVNIIIVVCANGGLI